MSTIEVSLEGNNGFHLLIDKIPGYAIYISDASGTIMSWNSGAQKLQGYEPSEVLGRNFSIFCTDEDRSGGIPGLSLQMAKNQGSSKIEGWRVRKDGSRFWAYEVIDPVLDVRGDFIVITFDLTPRKLAGDAIKRSYDQFRVFDQSVTDCAIYELDPDGRVCSWNSDAETIKGFSPDEIIGLNFRQFFTTDAQAANLPQRLLDTVARNGRFEGEDWRVRKNGELFWAHVTIDAVRDQGSFPLRFIAITRDLTAVRNAALAAEAARNEFVQSLKMEAMGRFAGAVAHDFNNLLTVILGGLEVIQLRLKPEPGTAELLQNAIQAAHRGRSLTQRMLSFSRREELKPEAINVAALVGGMSDLFKHTLGPWIMIETSFPSGLPDVFADRIQMELAILNLATNARDAMRDVGMISITASRGMGLDNIEYIRISVTDSGDGMDAATLDRASEAFFTTKGIGKGTGLGLSMVRGFAEQSSGCFDLRSAPGAGTVAELWLPAAIRTVHQDEGRQSDGNDGRGFCDG